MAFATLDRGAAADLEEAHLELRLARLKAHEDAQYVEGAIAQARRALDAAANANDDGRARANRVADAAVTFAERELDRRSVQRELLDTQRRLTETRERATAQRRVLEALMKERAALAREETQ
jgi:hypothetical protein